VPGTDRSANNHACPIHLVYRRAAGDGRASQPIPVEQTNQCQALIALLPAGRPAIGRPVCTTDILSVAILSKALSAGRRSAASRSANFRLHGLRLQRQRTRCPSRTNQKNQSVPGTDRSSNTPACPIHLVYRRAAGDGRAGQPIPAEQTNQCQALIALLPAGRPAIGRPVCTTDILSVAILSNPCASQRSAIGRSTFGGLRSPRVPASAATDKMSVVPRKIAASWSASDQCQALIALPTTLLSQSTSFTAEPQATAGPANRSVPIKPISARH